MRNIQIIVSLNAPDSISGERLAQLVNEAVCGEIDSSANDESDVAKIEVVNVVAA